ncbi:MAG: tetratricopeptide repeat protein [Desulfuromonadaceae bacterium]|nr:tetratricopeptide repeat protein [Desulfuromonadaceae bacterium]
MPQQGNSVFLYLFFSLVLTLTGCAPSLPVTPLPGTVIDGADLDRSRPWADYLKARLSADEGDLEQALDFLQRSATGDPGEAYLYTAQASVLLELERHEDARAALRQARQLAPDDLAAQLLQADLLYSEDRIDEAIDAFKNVAERYPEQDEILFHICRLQVELKRYDQAVETLERVLERSPESSRALLELARVEQLREHWSSAIKDYQTLIALEPDAVRPYLELGHLLETRHRLDEALALYQRASVAVEDDAGHFVRLQAMVLIQLERLQDARQLVEAALVDNDEVQTRLLYGFILLELRHFAAAEAIFREIVALPKELNNQIWLWLGRSLEGQQQWQQALAAYQQAEDDPVFRLEVLLHLVGLYQQLGRYDEAIASVESLLASGKLDKILFRQLYALCLMNEQPEKALKALERGLEQYPDEADFYYDQGVFYTLHHQFPQAVSALLRAIDKNPDHAAALNHLAYLYAESGEMLHAALDMAEAAVQLDGQGAYVDTLGWVYYKLGKLVQARHYLEQAHQLLPDDSEIREHLGDVYAALGLSDMARSAYQAVLVARPQATAVLDKLRELP